jgi:mono/diheme cytochrome c family protein
LSRPSALRLLIPFAVASLFGTGCWEQWSVAWWPQMKWQRSLLPFEQVTAVPDRQAPFMPPEGAQPASDVLLMRNVSLEEGNALPNPRPATLASLENGKVQFETFCSPCHGLLGHADGPVAGPPWGKGPFVGVLPIAGPIGSQVTKNFTDGHIFTVISQGIRRMPSYRRIPQSDRWDIVNYVRYLNDQGPGHAIASAAAPAVSAAPAAAPGPAGTTDGGAQP